MQKKPRQKSKLSTQCLMNSLDKEYGPFNWEPRYNPADELVFTILSQHTSDINSERAFKILMENFDSLNDIADAEISQIEKCIKSAGLYRIKAKRIKDVLMWVRAEVGSFDLSFLSEMPLEDAKNWLKRIDCIGPKTAAIILCFSLGMPAMPVDTHIYRVSKRLGYIGPKVSADKAHDILEPMVPPEDVFRFHLYLINHGRKVCKALRPLCHQCTISWGCPSRR